MKKKGSLQGQDFYDFGLIIWHLWGELGQRGGKRKLGLWISTSLNVQQVNEQEQSQYTGC